MNKQRISFARIIFALMTASIAGCGIAGMPPIEKDQAITLGPNEGIAGVVIDSLDPLNQISIESTDSGGQGMDIPKAPVGVNLYLFKVPAGHYCLTSFWFGNTRIYQTDQKHGVCFDVITGKIAYSGNIAPRAYGKDDLRTNQNYDWAGFEKKLKSEYPAVTAAYPIVTP